MIKLTDRAVANRTFLGVQVPCKKNLQSNEQHERDGR